MTVLTDIRELIRDTLAADLGLRFVDGRLDGPQERGSLGCVWTDRVEEDEDDVNYAVVTVGVRVFLRYERSREPSKPIDPAPLEQLVEKIQLSLRAKHSATAANFLRVVSAQIDLERRGVEVSVRAWTENLGSPMVG